MRSELNDIEKIERYLRNEMSSEERISFEKEMQSNPDLRKSVEEQKELLKGMERMKMKNDISKGKFKYRLQKGLVNIGIPVLITAAVTALIMNWSSNTETKPETPNSKPETKYELPALNENGDSLWADADKYIPYQIYSIDAEKDTVITGKDGMVVAIPANSFVDENGNAAKGKIDFELKEALNTETILEGGLSTTSNGELLETGGMFYINARQDGKSLKIAEGKNIYADVPSDPTKTGMMLFDGERLADGNINWVNPKAIEKPLVPVDIYSLNFYPPLYEDSLAKMGKDVTNKKYKDSLYYSFAGRTQNINNQKFATKESFPVLDAALDTIKGKIKYKTYIEQMKKLGFKYEAIEGVTGNEFTFDFELLRKGNDIYFIRHFILTFNRHLDLFSHKQNDNSQIDLCSPIFFEKSEGFLGVNPNIKSEYYEIFHTVVSSKTNFTIKGSFDYWLTSYVDGTAKKHKFELAYSHPIQKMNPNFPSCNNKDSEPFSGLNPAKVKSIWNDKFQNTLIATKEFEERMPYIHKLCSRGNNVLDMYVKNIDKKICTIDSMVANTLSGADKEQFLKFAAGGEGRVKTDDNCLKKLGDFYDEQTKIYTEAAKKTSEDYYKKNQERNEEATKKVNSQSLQEGKRTRENFQKEYAINLKDAYRQLGKTKPVIPFVQGRRTRVRVPNLGWKNVDRYVLEATVNRTTMNYTDSETGKKAVLKYEPLAVKIKDAENYDRVLVYLLPDQLNSFMRFRKEGDVYTEKLNMLFKHEIIILAYKGEEAFFKHIKDVPPGELNDISLEKMSQGEINANLTSLNKLQRADEMQKDVSHQFFLQADTKRRKVFLEKEIFIRRIERVIFPCGNNVWNTKDMSETENKTIIKQEF